MRRYEEGVRQKLADADSPHRWWRTLRESVFDVDQSVPPLVDPATGLLVSEPDRKAELLMHTFEAKQSSHILELPPTCHPQPVLRGVAFRSRKIRELLSGFDSYGGTDSLGFFPLFYKEIAIPFSPKFAKVLSILLRRDLFPECWREASITSIPKGAHRPLSLSIGLFLSLEGCWPVNLIGLFWTDVWPCGMNCLVMFSVGLWTFLNQTSINSYSLAKYNILMGRCLALWASHCGVSCACAVLQARARPS